MKTEIDMSKYTIGIDPYDKQETLEEFAEKTYLSYKNNELLYGDSEDLQLAYKAGVFDGAKLAQERSYSEQDMKYAYEQGAKLALISQSPLALHKGEFPTPQEWINEFNK